jgi:serine protease AprX
MFSEESMLTLPFCRIHGIRRALTVVAIATTLVTVGPAPAAAEGPGKPAPSKLDRHLQQLKAAPSGTARVIVRTKDGKQDAVAGRLGRRGRRTKANLSSLEGFVSTVNASDLGALERDPDVVGVSTDAVVQSFAASLDVSAAGAMLDDVLGVESNRWTGDKIGIAVIDSGLARVRDLDGARTDTFVDVTGSAGTKPFDDYGHGTHVAGLIGGTGRQSLVKIVRLDRDGTWKPRDVPYYAGVAPHARLVSFKVLDENGAGFTSDVIRALDYIVDNRATLNIQVVNLSLGHPILEPAATDPLVLAVERAVRAGLIVVAAAGNYGLNPETGVVGYAGITSPGNAPSAITVGAYDPHGTVSRLDDTIPDYSSRGPSWYDGYAKPDVVAPGSGLIATAAPGSTLYRRYPGRHVRDRDGLPSYFRLSGTSMATAVTSGTVALMLEAARDAHKGTLTPNAIKAILQYTALPMPGYDALTQGAGSLNATGAIELARAIDPRAPTGAYWLDAIPSGTTTVAGVTYEWAHAVIWGNAVIWGSTLDTNQQAWSQAVIWGSGSVWGNAMIWGSNIVWDQPGVWAHAVIWGSTNVGLTNGNAVIWGSGDGLSPTTVAWGGTDDVR